VQRIPKWPAFESQCYLAYRKSQTSPSSNPLAFRKVLKSFSIRKTSNQPDFEFLSVHKIQTRLTAFKIHQTNPSSNPLVFKETPTETGSNPFRLNAVLVYPSLVSIYGAVFCYFLLFSYPFLVVFGVLGVLARGLIRS